MKVGIIGLGTVGRAQARMFKDHEQVHYDPLLHGSNYPLTEMRSCDLAVMCVPTPRREDGRADLTYVHQAYDALPHDTPLIIRSTVPPGTTDRLTRFHGAPACFVPEFLQEREGGRWRNSTDVPYMILGGKPSAVAYFCPRLQRVYLHAIHECTALQAELIKYTANCYWAARVTFVNEMAAICKAHGEDWELVREGWLQDPRMSEAYTAMAGFPPGFGGPCLVKDLHAIIADAAVAGYKAEFLQAVLEANERFLA